MGPYLFAIKSLNAAGGGAERVLVDVVNGLAQRGYPIEVLTFDYPGQAFYNLEPGIRRHDMAFTPAGKPMPRVSFLTAIPRIRATVRAIQPRLVVAFMHSTYVPLGLALSGMGVRMVASEHTDAKHYRGRPLERRLRQFVEKRAAARTVPSDAALRSFQRDGEIGRLVVPNPIEIERFSHSPVSSHTLPVALSVGTLREEKDHATLVRAFALVAGEFPEWRLRLVGDGPLVGSIRAQVAELGLQGKIELAGPTRDVASAYAAARFVVLPSRYEAFGLVAAEALAAGRPVLAFDDCAGLREVVSNGATGLLVRGSGGPGARAESLATGLRCLMADPTLCARLGTAGPASVKRYAIDKVLDRWETVIETALGAPVREESASEPTHKFGRR